MRPTGRLNHLVLLPLICFCLMLSLFVLTASAQTPTPIPTTPTPLTTFFVAPSPTPQACATPQPFTAGQRVVLTPGVNLRHLPSLSGAVTNYYTMEVLLNVVDGPVCANGYNWWRVQGVGEPGWVIEGRPGRYFLNFAYEAPETVCYPSLGLPLGEDALLLTGVLIREGASQDALVLSNILTDERVTVLSGPICAENINWWQVRFRQDANTTLTGYIAEGYPGEYWIQSTIATPAPVYCPRALRLRVGDRVGITYDDAIRRRLRAEPTVNGAIVAQLVGGVALEIVDGNAICADGYNWWYVHVLTTDIYGWVAEGLPGNYWVDIISMPR